MRKVDDAGICPEPDCGCILEVIKTKSYKRYAKCENPECSYSFSLPKAGKLTKTGVLCPKTKVQILIVSRSQYSNSRNKAYFWAKGPCFNCMDYNHDKCKPYIGANSEAEELISFKDLILEFEENNEYEFYK